MLPEWEISITKHRFIVIYTLHVIEPSIGLKNTEEAYF